MITIRAGGVDVPAIGFGTWPLKDEACAAAVADALAIGYRHIDTAARYGNEAAVGEGLRRAGLPRDEVFVTSKVWYTDLAPDAFAASVERSLRDLGLDYVDLLLIHWPEPGKPIEPALDTLLSYKQAGRARLVGVSNFSPRQLRQAIAHAGRDISCIQVECHPFLAQRTLRDAIAHNDGFLTAYTPLARGLVAEDETLVAIGRAHGKTAAQVALRWLVQQGRVAAIPKAGSSENRKANLDVFDFALTAEEMARIDALDRGERVVFPPWSSEKVWSVD